MPVYKLTQLPQFKKKNAGTTYLIWLTRPRIPYGNASLENFPEESDVATSNASWRAFHEENAEKLREHWMSTNSTFRWRDRDKKSDWQITMSLSRLHESQFFTFLLLYFFLKLWILIQIFKTKYQKIYLIVY